MIHPFTGSATFEGPLRGMHFCVPLGMSAGDPEPLGGSCSEGENTWSIFENRISFFQEPRLSRWMGMMRTHAL